VPSLRGSTGRVQVQLAAGVAIRWLNRGFSPLVCSQRSAERAGSAEDAVVPCSPPTSAPSAGLRHRPWGVLCAHQTAQVFAEPLAFSSSSPCKQGYLRFGGGEVRGNPSCSPRCPPWAGDPEAWASHSSVSASLAFRRARTRSPEDPPNRDDSVGYQWVPAQPLSSCLAPLPGCG